MKHKEFNVEEYNKMCAEFMGYVALPYTEEQSFIHKNHPFDVFHINDFNFDTDWNWIMEVVEKIEKTYAWVNIKGCAVDITQQFSISKPTKKEAVIQSIWQFLNWYNENKQDETHHH